jgi:hypothetical protein
MAIGPTIENLRKKRADEAALLKMLYSLPSPVGGFENNTPAELAELRRMGLTGRAAYSDPYEGGMDYGAMRPAEQKMYAAEDVPQSAEYYARGLSRDLVGNRATNDLFGSGASTGSLVGDMAVGGGLLGAIGAKAPLTAYDAGQDAARGNYGKAAIGGVMAALEGLGLSELGTGARALKNIGGIGTYLDEGMFNVADTPATRQYFADSMRAAQASHGPIGKSVDVYTPDEYAGTRMAMTPAGDAGYVVKPDGEIASVVKAKGSPTKDFAGSVMRRSEAQGGNWLNAFDTALTDLYGRSGFQPVSRLPFNEEMAQEAFGKEALDAFMQANAKYNGGRPDLVFMARNPSAGIPDRAARGGFATDDYDVAMQKLNDEMVRLGYRR